MLEETLSSTKYSPAEAALTLKSFVEIELAAGGASTEARFFRLFSMLCDRVFGVISPKNKFQHEVGGWLSRHVRWERPSMSLSDPHHQQRRSGSSSSSSSSSSGSIRMDPVVRLLGAPGANQQASSGDGRLHPLTLIEAYAKEAEHRPNVRYPFPFQALPKATQDAWIFLIEAALGGAPAPDKAPSENSARLLGSLFRVRPLEQTQLKIHQQNKMQKKDNRRPLQLSPMYNSPKSPSGASTSKGKELPPNIMLSMLEYYLLIFIRYPLAAPPPPPKQPQPTSRGVHHHSIRRSEPYGDSVYYQLFQEYVSYYIPVNVPQGHSNGFPSLQRPSELFLRIIISLWFEGQNRLPITSKAMKIIHERRPSVEMDLNMSYDLAKAGYVKPPYQITRCLHKLIIRAVSDGAILDLAQDIHGGFRGPRPEMLCLSPTMTILQQPFYNYVRNAFRHGSIHARQSPFYAALNDWLMWLEPWNTKYEKRKADPTKRILGRASQGPSQANIRVTYPKANQRSLYKHCWEPYIASNLHLYTVPLAIFLRRARELDFSPSEYHRSVHIVSRVFRVFTPDVVNVINKLLDARPYSMPLSSIVERHEQNLGPYAPPSTPLVLKSCQEDMHTLLEEIYLQHMKKVEDLDFIDRGVAWVEGLFGQGAYRGEEKELQKLVAKAKVIVTFPHDYEVLPTMKSRSSADPSRVGYDNDDEYAGNGDMTIRDKYGFLSDTGRMSLISGTTKCNLEDIGYVGDKMYAKPQGYEISFLAILLPQFSTYINQRVLGINDNEDNADNDADNDNDDKKNKNKKSSSSYFYHYSPIKRVNLRFLADYRNLISLSIVSFCIWFMWL